MKTDEWGHTCVVGLGWGDEGKGKVVDLLGEHFEVIVRYNGGANAGHTIRIGERTFAFHALPSGTLRSDRMSVIGPGVVLDLGAATKELDALADRGIVVGDNLRISDRAHLVMPYHKIEDRLSEADASGDNRIGTTARGIGPCYADKMRRHHALRVCDLADRATFAERLHRITEVKRRTLTALYGDCGELDAERTLREFVGYADRIKPFVCDTGRFLRDAHTGGRKILYESANGTLLDVDHGTYPFVTSSNSSALGVHAGAGVSAGMLNTCIGVLKAYATRVGAGPFPSELHDEIGERIRRQGNEFGTTTGRPRRCGWFDAVSARYAAELNGISSLALMHLDTLTGLKRIGICDSYETDAGRGAGYPASERELSAMRPGIRFVPGWKTPVRDVRRRSDLPGEAQSYLSLLEELVGVPIRIISVGPERTQTITE